MTTTTQVITATDAGYTAASAGESSISAYTETKGTVEFLFAAAPPAANAPGLPLPDGWSNFNGITGANLYVKAVKNSALVPVVKS